MSGHGARFDEFSSQPSHSHGGSFFDVGYSQATHDEAHGKLYDLFGVKPDAGTTHGERYDEFGWKEMPAKHGQLFDSDFGHATAGEGEHGTTWFDEFRGGTEVRFLSEGKGYEGTVIECNREFATVKDHGGQLREVGLSQFLQYRSPTQTQADPGLPGPAVESASASDPVAHGAFHGDRRPVPTEMPSRVQHVAPGGSNDNAGRIGLPDGLMNTFERLKAVADELDVEKSGVAGGSLATHQCSSCKAGYQLQGSQLHRVKNSQVDKIGTSASVGTCSNCGSDARAHIKPVPAGGTAQHFGKSVDATATAVQGQDLEGERAAKTVGHRSNCPRKGSAPCGGETDGHCSICNATVRDHEALGKSSTGDLGIDVPDRAGHPNGGGHRFCPHCGQELIDHQTEQGSPSRKHVQGSGNTFPTVTAHKCLGTSIDLLKALA